MRRQNPWAKTMVSGASTGPASRTASGTPSEVVTTWLRSLSSRSKSSLAQGSSPAAVRSMIVLRAEAPTRVATAVSPAPPASQAF